MIEIIFQKDWDGRCMYRHIMERLSAFPAQTGKILFDEERKKLRIHTDDLPKEAFYTIKEAVYEFIVIKKRDDWFRGILSERFFYQDTGEQDQILDIIYSVIEGHREDLASFVTGPDEKGYVLEAINEIFKGSISFSFDSFVMFRLKPFLDVLRSFVEIAIDEYKLEQDYQMFIQTLREFLCGRTPLHEHVHVKLDNETVFFNSDFMEIKRSELVKGIDRKLLGNHPVYVDSVTIAPLLSMAPSTIYLYTDEPEQPLVRTIGNIFEERVKLCPLKALQRNNGHSNEKVQ
ncbi:putative sporulation protein YtxC [Mesobacillus foraminis]|uniref:sporulation protein YtxC n=1 Tax=Mesobacillus foraminis TaxID=279826 RepID=UPI001BEA5190|nr:sporulation protein YtxC [Mesobacillus foraminis]MBT2754495.1 putative sporulation protein YtxC [Mesobacillus foraminis]